MPRSPVWEWRRRRIRRADLRWRPAIAVPGGARPGLVARWSKRALALEAIALTGLAGSGLVWSGARIDGWDGRIPTALCAVVVPVMAISLFKTLRYSGYVAITSQGVVVEGDAVRWEEIRAVRRTKHGVHLVLRPPARWRRIDLADRDCAVSDERLAHVIEYYLATPHHRVALDASAPGPRGAVH